MTNTGGSGGVGHIVGRVWLKKINSRQNWVFVAGFVTWTANQVLVVLFVQNGNFLSRPSNVQNIWVWCYLAPGLITIDPKRKHFHDGRINK